MSEEGMNPRRRRLLVITSGLGVVGTVFALTPFVKSMLPSARAKAAGAPVEVDISKIEPGQLLTVEWRGKPVWILRRTPAMLDELKKDENILADPNSTVTSQQPKYAQNLTRSIKPEYLAVDKVSIKDRHGNVVLHTTADGPFLLARLPAGLYTVSASDDGIARDHTVHVVPGKQRRVTFEW